jgi:hypothetical protein
MPEEVIVADASPEADQTRERVLREAPSLPTVTRFTYLKTPRGTSVQRNIILDHMQSDVVMFLDDDTLVSPEYTAKLVGVYEADTAGRIAGVEGLALDGREPSATPAAPANGSGRRGLRGLVGGATSVAQQMLQSVVRRFALPDYPAPLLRPVHGVPEPLKELPLEPIRSMNGCVMSFRANLARQARFNEHLKRYGFMEDFELSYRLGKEYALVRRLDAPARHVRDMGGRLDPSLVRYLCLINVAYISRTVMDCTPALRQHLERYAHRNMQLEVLQGLFRKTGFSQYRSAKAGLSAVRAILRAPAESFHDVYDRALQQGFDQGRF